MLGRHVGKSHRAVRSKTIYQYFLPGGTGETLPELHEDYAMRRARLKVTLKGLAAAVYASDSYSPLWRPARLAMIVISSCGATGLVTCI